VKGLFLYKTHYLFWLIILLSILQLSDISAQSFEKGSFKAFKKELIHFNSAYLEGDRLHYNHSTYKQTYQIDIDDIDYLKIKNGLHISKGLTFGAFTGFIVSLSVNPSFFFIYAFGGGIVGAGVGALIPKSTKIDNLSFYLNKANLSVHLGPSQHGLGITIVF